MFKEKTKIIILELPTTLTNKELSIKMNNLMEMYFGLGCLSQKPKIQVAQQPKK